MTGTIFQNQDCWFTTTN